MYNQRQSHVQSGVCIIAQRSQAPRSSDVLAASQTNTNSLMQKFWFTTLYCLLKKSKTSMTRIQESREKFLCHPTHQKILPSFYVEILSSYLHLSFFLTLLIWRWTSNLWKQKHLRTPLYGQSPPNKALRSLKIGVFLFSKLNISKIVSIPRPLDQESEYCPSSILWKCGVQLWSLSCPCIH